MDLKTMDLMERLRDCTKEELLELIELDVDTETLHMMVSKLPLSEDEKLVIGMIHLLFCVGHEEGGACLFIAESSMIGTWELQDHVYWTARTRSFLKPFGLSVRKVAESHADFIVALRLLSKLGNPIRQLVGHILNTKPDFFTFQRPLVHQFARLGESASSPNGPSETGESAEPLSE